MKLSLCIISYNHKALFREAIESAVSQQTDFPFEIIACDDGSTDGTADVLREYAARYPDLIRPVIREKNIGPYRNFIDAHNRATGEYVAHLDGDDLCLPGKLQRQVDFLDEHPDVSVVWHAVKLVDKDGSRIGKICMRNAIAPDGYLSLEDALEIGSLGIHSSVMYRATARTSTDPPVNPIDWFYAVEFLSHGKGYQLAEELGVYRRLDGVSISGNAASHANARMNLGKAILHYIGTFPQHRKRLFTLALLYALCDVYARTRSVTAMIEPLWASRTWLPPSQFFSALARFRAVGRAFRGLG